MRHCRLTLLAAAVSLLPVLLAGAALGAGPPAAPAERSVTVFPVVVTPAGKVTLESRKGIAEVIGMVLERTGLENVRLADTEFVPQADDSIDREAAAFGDFIRRRQIATQYALLPHLFGSPGSGVQEIRTILVDKQGQIALADRDDSETYDKTSNLEPKDPMTSSIFVARKVQRLWNLEDPLRQDAPTGALHARWREKTGVPSEEEVAATNRRLAVMKEELAGKKLAVYAVRTGDVGDAECAARLAEAITADGIATAAAADGNPDFEIRGHYNEQKVLWDAARGFRRFLQDHPPTADYGLFAHYGIASPAAESSKVGGVHFIVCDRSGQWVLVDFQNSHHVAFQEIDPTSAADCNRLVVRRLKERLAE